MQQLDVKFGVDERPPPGPHRLEKTPARSPSPVLGEREKVIIILDRLDELADRPSRVTPDFKSGLADGPTSIHDQV